MASKRSRPAASIPAPPTEPVSARLGYREAYERVVPEQAALNPAKLLVINIDVTNAYTTVIGVLPRLMTFRDRARQLIEYEIKNFDNLHTYALALMHAHGEYISASLPPEALPVLNEEAVQLRDNLYSDALALAKRGLISGESLRDLKNPHGYRNLAEELVGLSSLLRRNWVKIGDRTPITLAELDQAENISERLLRAVALRDKPSSILADAIQRRMAVFTLFANAYAQVRRAISFLRWDEEDLEEIAPSLYAGRRRNKSERPPPPAAAPP